MFVNLLPENYTNAIICGGGEGVEENILSIVKNKLFHG